MLTLVVMLVLPTASAWSKAPKGHKAPKAPKGPKHVTVDDDGPADYDNIQDAIDAAPRVTRISVAPGEYGGFVVENRKNLKIERKGKHDTSPVIVTGAVSVSTYKGTFPLTIGVVNSTHVEISGFTVEAASTDPFTIAYFNSTGKIKNNEVYGNTGSELPGNAIAAFGTSGHGTVTIEGNYVHDYGKIGILVNARRRPYFGDDDSDNFAEVEADKNEYEPDGIHARIKKNMILGTDFYPYLGYASYDRVQDGIQVVGGASADIEDNDISGNFQSTDSEFSCDGILLVDAYKVKTKHNNIRDNWYGIHIQQHRIPIQDYISETKLEHDNIEYNVFGIAASSLIPGDIHVKHAKIKYNYWYGIRIDDTDGILFDHCDIQENWSGLLALGWGSYDTIADYPAAAFTHCNITNNLDTDVANLSHTLVFEKVEYDRYFNDSLEYYLQTNFLFEDGILIE